MQFGEATQSNILLNYNSEKDVATWILNGVMVITIISVFPLNVFPLRSLIDDMILEHYMHLYGLRLPEFQWCRFVPETIGIVAAALVVNLVCNDISVVFSFTGATACTLVAYVLPCMFSARANGGWTPLLYAVTALTVMAAGLSVFQIFTT
jgi:amino acid permease